MATKPTGSIRPTPLYKVIFFRFHLLITGVLVLLIATGGYLLLLEPKYQRIVNGDTTGLATLDVELAQRQAYLGELETFIVNYRQINPSDIDRLKKILPSDEDVPELFVQFEALAAANNLFLSSISINEVPESAVTQVKSQGVKRITVSLDLVGNDAVNRYAEVKRFLTDLESNLRLFDINAVYFSPDSPEYSINLTAYYYPTQ